MADYRKQAYYLRNLGINTCPLKLEGGKTPMIKWKHLQEKMITDAEIEKYMIECGGLCAIAGKISNLYILDFDLDKALLSQNYWKEFMAKVPDNLKRKMLINQTRSGGYHVFLRMENPYKSRKITHRALTIQEIYDRYQKALSDGLDMYKVSSSLLNHPKACIIESRGESSYGVISHPQYKRFYGKEFHYFTKEEVDFLLEVAYSLDFTFLPQKKFTGDVVDYKLIREFNDNSSAEEIAAMIVETGLYNYSSINHNKGVALKRVGSSSPYSCIVFSDSGVVHDFGISNIFAGDSKDAHTPFETLCACHNFTEQEGIEYLKEVKK